MRKVVNTDTRKAIFYFRSLYMQNRLTVFLLTFSITLALMLPVSAALPSPDDASLYDNIIRLHVIANSDSDEDQRVKLLVRDGILGTVSSLMDGITDRNEAEAVISANLSLIEATANSVLAEVGSEHIANVTLTKEAYPTREYEGFSLPAGTYTSLRVLIGAAEGKNWWCVLYPKLCIGAERTAAVIDETELIEAGLTPSQVRIITGSTSDVIIKFRFLEFIGRLFN